MNSNEIIIIMSCSGFFFHKWNGKLLQTLAKNNTERNMNGIPLSYDVKLLEKLINQEFSVGCPSSESLEQAREIAQHVCKGNFIIMSLQF